MYVTSLVAPIRVPAYQTTSFSFRPVLVHEIENYSRGFSFLLQVRVTFLDPPPLSCGGAVDFHSYACTRPIYFYVAGMALRSKRKGAPSGVGDDVLHLVNKHATKEEKDAWLVVPLDLALSEGKLELVTELVNLGAHIGAEFRGRNGRTALCSAAYGGDPCVIRMVLEAGAGLNTGSGRDRRTPLAWAARAGHLAAVRLFVDKGAAIDAPDANGSTPLHHAAAVGNVEIMELMLGAGASVHARNKWGSTPLQTAGVYRCGVEVASTLIRRGANVNTLNNSKNTPLCRAVRLNHVAEATFLLDKGADAMVDYTSNALTYPLLFLAKDSLPMTQLLEARGARVNTGTGCVFGFTAMHWAAGRGTYGVLECLIRPRRLEKKFGVLHRDGVAFRGGTALHAALIFGPERLECISLLLQEGADVNKQDDDGLTPLAALCHSFHMGSVPLRIKAADLLLRNGAKEDITDDDDKTPMDLIRLAADPDSALKAFIERAPSGRAWRRRGIWAMCRARSQEGRLGACGDTDASKIANWVVNTNEEGIFRAIVGFL